MPNNNISIHDGLHIEIHETDTSISDSLRKTGVHEPNLTAYFKETVQTDDHILDIGANIGYFSLLFASLTEVSGQVIAAEPDPTNIVLLERNIERNGFDHDSVGIVQKAISDHIGTTKFYRDSKSKGAHSIEQTDNTDGDSITVETTTVDELIDSTIDIIKIDVEGAENRVLDGATNTIQEYRPVIVFEMAPPIWSSSPVETLQGLKQQGYKFRCIDTEGIRNVTPSLLVEFYEEHKQSNQVNWINVIAEHAGRNP